MFSRSRLLLITLILSTLAVPLMSQTASDHIVPAPDLHQAVRAAAHARQDHLTKLDSFFASEPARKAFETVKLDPAKVTQALALLSDDELARLAAQSEKIQHDIAAGSLTNQQITYILIALGTAVIILVIVAAR
jgi:hypothetical protein